MVIRLTLAFLWFLNENISALGSSFVVWLGKNDATGSCSFHFYPLLMDFLTLTEKNSHKAGLLPSRISN